MDFNQVFNERFKWQEETIEKIKKLLLLKPENELDLNKNSKKLAVIYGFPQIGKTTLILRLIGIKNEYFQEVYDVLRAGIHRGNSSTSTSIFYCKSDTNEYGIECKNINEEKSKVQYCSKEKLKEKLKEIRNEVEKNIKKVDILHIHIPEIYFEENQTLEVLDTPGVDSRNKKEETHLKGLMNRFLSIANVTMIVCNANEIQSLENRLNYLDKNWKYLDKEYVVVTTHSYSQASVKKYFDVPKDKRKQGFDQFVQDTYIEEIKKVLGTGSRIEVFPIEVGDSLESLFVEYKEDKEEIQRTVERGLQRIRKAINERKGNSLKIIIDTLRKRIEVYMKELLEDVNENILLTQDLINELKDDITKKQKEFKCISQKYKSIVQDRRWYENIKINMPSIYDYQFEDLVNEYIEENFWGDKCFKDNREDKGFYHSLKGQLREFTEEYLKGYSDILTRLNIDLKAEEVEKKIFEEVEEEQNILGQLYPDGFFLFREKIKEEKIKEIIKKAITLYKENLFKKIKKIIDINAQQKIPSEWRIRELECAQQICQRGLQELNENLQEENKKHSNYENEKIKLQLIKNSNSDELKNYMEMARKEYKTQYNNVIEKINLKTTTNEEKMLLVLFLGVMEKDYENLESEEYIL